MDGEYSQQWDDLRRIQRRALTAVIAAMAIWIVVSLSSRFLSGRLGTAVGFALFFGFAASIVKFFLVMIE